MDTQTDFGRVTGQNEDLTQILPIQQKRTIAFVNAFIMQTVSFLNHFAQSCESQFMELEYRMQSIEASLLILESQLSSIDSLNTPTTETDAKTDKQLSSEDKELDNTTTTQDNECKSIPENQDIETQVENKLEETEIKVDSVYQKFFKMVQVGVPLQAVKLKLQSEGLDPNILDLPGNVQFQ